jgi:hypothetical protein
MWKTRPVFVGEDGRRAMAVISGSQHHVSRSRVGTAGRLADGQLIGPLGGLLPGLAGRRECGWR